VDDRPTRATIDLGALRANFAEARRRAGGREIIAVIKADGYGHGAVRVARTLVASGCRRLAVLTTSEAAELRDAGIEAALLLLGGVHGAAEAAEALALSATPVLHDAGGLAQVARAAAAHGKPVPVHVEVDTGMHRMGVAPERALELLMQVEREPALRLEGVYTQLARADEPDLGPSFEQLARFADLLRALRAEGVDPGLVHFANSAGLLLLDQLEAALPEAGAVRPGLMLYGVAPSPHIGAALRPVMTLRTRVVQLRGVAQGAGVGYGATWRAPRPGQIATLALGYADGVPCASANRGSALLRGRRVPIAGRVSMDYVTVDVGEGPVEVGDEVILFGEGAEGRLPVEEAAAAADTISYELLVRVGRRVPRVEVE
jgi:alanine racemase